MSITYTAMSAVAGDPTAQVQLAIGTVVQIAVSVAAFALIHAALSTFLWAWLAWLIAAIGSAVIGTYAGVGVTTAKPTVIVAAKLVNLFRR